MSSAKVQRDQYGQVHYTLNGEKVNKATFVTTAVVRAVSYWLAIFMVGKYTGIGFKRAAGLGFAYNTLRSLDEIRVDVADS